jgi:hypothetical protein
MVLYRFVWYFSPGRAKNTRQKVKICSGQIDAAHVQPASAGVVGERGGFSPARRMCSMRLTTTNTFQIGSNFTFQEAGRRLPKRRIKLPGRLLDVI